MPTKRYYKPCNERRNKLITFASWGLRLLKHLASRCFYQNPYLLSAFKPTSCTVATSQFPYSGRAFTQVNYYLQLLYNMPWAPYTCLLSIISPAPRTNLITLEGEEIQWLKAQVINFKAWSWKHFQNCLWNWMPRAPLYYRTTFMVSTHATLFACKFWWRIAMKNGTKLQNAILTAMKHFWKQ